MEKVKTIDFKFWFGVAVISVVLYLLYGLFVKRENERKIAMEQRKNVICPSLLSIGRSARDTLIIMKNESLCNEFVLDTLQ
jgi:hypothetical protein